MRALPLLVVASAMLAGCASEEQGVALDALELGSVEGVVTDPGLRPLAGATVRVDGRNESATTDASGAYLLHVPPGEHLLLASMDGYKGGALRTNAQAGISSRLDFALAPVPTIAPSIRPAEAHGLLSCGAALYAGEQEHRYDCGGSDPNAKASVEFGVDELHGLEGAVVEVVWTPTTQLTSMLAVAVWSGEGEAAEFLGYVEAPGPINLPIPQRVLVDSLVAGVPLRVEISPTGSLTDEEAGADGGAALQQPFTVYLSLFYHAAPPAGYSVLEA